MIYTTFGPNAIVTESQTTEIGPCLQYYFVLNVINMEYSNVTHISCKVCHI
jgi:hypothetical protein